ncbi:5828_t:CDS:2, partial [Acaulospora morrowiae]
NLGDAAQLNHDGIRGIHNGVQFCIGTRLGHVGIVTITRPIAMISEDRGFVKVSLNVASLVGLAVISSSSLSLRYWILEYLVVIISSAIDL